MKTTSRKNTSQSYRNEILKFAMKQYGTEPDYPWIGLPNYAVLRHSDNRKWYAIIMDVPRNKLGLSGQTIIDILDIKCDPILGGSLRSDKGILPAYHMHRGNWLTVLLDGSVDLDKIFWLLEMSFDMTASRQKKSLTDTLSNREWIVPANPKYYDLEKAFSGHEMIQWKQSNHILVGDMVYLYVAAPVSAILYKCKAVEVDIPYNYDDGKVHMSRVMKLQLLKKYNKESIGLNKLKEHGIFAVRGPRSMPSSLSNEIEAIYHE